MGAAGDCVVEFTSPAGFAWCHQHKSGDQNRDSEDRVPVVPPAPAPAMSGTGLVTAILPLAAIALAALRRQRRLRS